MEVNVTVDWSRFGRKARLLEQFTQEALEVAGLELYEFLVDYHADIDWKEGRWFPGAYSGEFAQKVVSGWQYPDVQGNTVVLRNTFGLLRWKTTGGTITPQRASKLTIPLVSMARGRSAAEYQSATGDRLFRAGSALCRKIGKKIEAIYALSYGVSQREYPKAMPKDSEMVRVIDRSIRQFARRIR
jgi:hypothetical protein